MTTTNQQSKYNDKEIRKQATILAITLIDRNLWTLEQKKALRQLRRLLHLE